MYGKLPNLPLAPVAATSPHARILNPAADAPDGATTNGRNQDVERIQQLGVGRPVQKVRELVLA